MDNTQVKYKCCSKCRESKPATKEFFYAKKSNKDGLNTWCKVCTNTSNTKSRSSAYVRWKGIVSRCYVQSDQGYTRYGVKGVKVCNEWRNPDVFIEWYNKYNIQGWEIDKDIVGTGDYYSPENCVFVCNSINTFFTFIKHPKVCKRGGKYDVNISIKNATSHLKGDTEEDVLEQFYLFKELYLEKLVWEMKEEHRKLCEKYPNTPEISPKLLAVLENFSTEEYLRKKRWEDKLKEVFKEE